MAFNPAEKRDAKGRWTRLAGLLKEHGGFTHDLVGDKERDAGFAVAAEGHEEKIPGLATEADLKRYVAKNHKTLTSPKAHFGAWHDTSTDTTYLDASYLHDNMAEAMQSARENKQLAIYDLNGGKEIRTLDGDWQPNLDAMHGKDLEGLPSKPTAVPGHGTYTFHSNKSLQKVASKYNKAHGLGKHPTDYAPVDPVKGAQIAKAFEEMKHDPSNPEVAEAYAALKKETLAQYEALTKAGYGYDFYPDGGDPYANSPREAIYDLTHNHHMYVFPTLGKDGGFGSLPTNRQDHPLLEKVPGLQWGGQDVTYNDVFRAVHDSMAHAKEGLGFRARGEDNAYRQHASMFSDKARKALASETRGQNSWLNFGPYGESNRTANTANTVFADQKAGILPDWAIDPEFHKKGTKDMAMQTPWNAGSSTIDLSDDGRIAFWKQILPKQVVHYTGKDGKRHTADFNEQYLQDLANNRMVDKIGFLLADKDNAHTMDPERWRGDVVQLEVRDDGLYGKIVFPNREAAKAVLANPDLPVSARIVDGERGRSDGTSVSRGIIHVLGTLDPQVSGMSGWQVADLSTEAGDLLDLTAEHFEEKKMAEKKTALSKPVTEFTEEEIENLTDEELDLFLAELSDLGADILDEDDVEDVEDETVEEREPEMALSHEMQSQIDLANARAAKVERELAQAKWDKTRAEYLAAGVPPYLLDLAQPVLNRADEFVVDLSHEEGDGAEVNVAEIVGKLLDAAKGTIDLSVENGHSGTFHAGDGEDPDAEALAAWDNQF